MPLKLMIIDEERDFRALLTHHVTTRWEDAEITSYDPGACGHLPDSFSGAGNDIVLLGNRLGERDGADVVRRFLTSSIFPPLVYFGAEAEKAPVIKAGAAAFFARDRIRHDALIVRLSDILREGRQKGSTDSLFVGDERAGIDPLIRGYRFIRKLANTEHSSVYLAERTSDGIEVVLKVLRQIPDVNDTVGAFDRFLQEYELIADIDHPNVVRIYDLGVSDDHAHIAMEYLDAGSLKQRIAGGIREVDAVEYFRQMVSAIGAIHEVGILHRDLKPGNVMLRSDGSIALIDFGLAKRMRLEMEITGSGEIFGTPYYMSPEQGHGRPIDERSDIYSLGILLFEMLTGRKPYTADTAMGILFKHAQATVPLLPARVARYQALVNLLLAKDPANRLQSAKEILEWL